MNERGKYSLNIQVPSPIRFKRCPKYFDSEMGQAFLEKQKRTYEAIHGETNPDKRGANYHNNNFVLVETTVGAARKGPAGE